MRFTVFQFENGKFLNYPTILVDSTFYTGFSVQDNWLFSCTSDVTEAYQFTDGDKAKEICKLLNGHMVQADVTINDAEEQ